MKRRVVQAACSGLVTLEASEKLFGQESAAHRIRHDNLIRRQLSIHLELAMHCGVADAHPDADCPRELRHDGAIDWHCERAEMGDGNDREAGNDV